MLTDKMFTERYPLTKMLTNSERDLLTKALEAVESTTGEGSFQDWIYEAASNLRALMRRLERDRKAS